MFLDGRTGWMSVTGYGLFGSEFLESSCILVVLMGYYVNYMYDSHGECRYSTSSSLLRFNALSFGLSKNLFDRNHNNFPPFGLGFF